MGGTQYNLGNALEATGLREGGASRLKEAVAAFREALTEPQAPADWAAVQNNLGIALTVLGKRKGGTARLEEAVAAYHEALKVFDREHATSNLATTKGALEVAEKLLAAQKETCRALSTR